MEQGHSENSGGKPPKRRKRDFWLKMLRKTIPKHLRKKYRVYKRPDGGISFSGRGLTEEEALLAAYSFLSTSEMFKLIQGEACDPKYQDLLVRLRARLEEKKKRRELEEKARRAGPEIGEAFRETLDGPHN